MILLRSLTVVIAALPLASAAAGGSPPSSPVELAVLDGESLARVELRVEIDGTPVEAVWDRTFARLFAYADRNDDGALDEKEAARLPSTIALRQAMGNGFVPPVGPPPEFSELDTTGDGSVAVTELVAYYRRTGAGSVWIGVGRLPASDRLADALIKAIDANRDGGTDAAEWNAAADLLTRFDANDDEQIGAGELVPKLVYPGAAGTLLLTPASAGATAPDVIAALPLRRLPADAGDVSWAEEWSRRSGGLKSTDELTAWRRRAPDACWTVSIGKAPADAQFGFAGHHVRVQGWTASGTLVERVSSARDAISTRFENLGNRSQTKGNLRRRDDLSWLTPFADRNADGTLDRAEVDAWLDLQSQIASGQVIVTLLDHAGLFEVLDTSHNGALSERELRSAWTRLNEVGCIRNNVLDRAGLSHLVLAVISRGYPDTLARETRRGPAWSRAMDRNGDGDISRREFLGPPSEFEKLDRDHDGLIDAEEAASLPPSTDASPAPQRKK